MTAQGPLLFLFDSTTAVMWAEEVAQEGGVPVEIVPAPRDVPDICGLALRTSPGHAGALAGLLEREGINFMRHV
ncbi:MAG: DUF3343 domain-containing protein [Longimicrobiales bacterium]